MKGKTATHFKILVSPGGGGMGVVYHALDLHLERPVALKFLPTHLTSDEEARQRFMRDARAASALDHGTDIWSLGVVLYEMLAGRRPLEVDYEQAVSYATVNAEVKPILGVPEELRAVVAQAVTKDVSRRYPPPPRWRWPLSEYRRMCPRRTTCLSVGTTAVAGDGGWQSRFRWRWCLPI